MLDSYSILIIGILVSIIFYELTDISPGGIIVPGLLVMYFNSVERIIYTRCGSIKNIAKRRYNCNRRKNGIHIKRRKTGI